MATKTPTKKPILTKAADWTAQNKYWLLAVAVLLAAGLSALWALDARRFAQLSAMRAEYTAVSAKLKTAESETAAARQALEQKTAALAAMQMANDRRVKEVTANAYRQAIDMPDDSLVDAYNAVISGARQRNAGRERADTGPEE
ncbi:MAG: hypothetical protein RR340_10220 [Cloacibacillus sp.]